jgi:hypothetical protein
VEERRRPRRDMAGGGGGGGLGRGGGGSAGGRTRAWRHRVEQRGPYDTWALVIVSGFKPVQTESINSNTFKFISNNFIFDSIQKGLSRV